MSPMEIVATMGMNNIPIGSPYGAVERRPFATNGQLFLLDNERPDLGRCTTPAHIEGFFSDAKKRLSGQHVSPREHMLFRAAIDFDGVPSGPVFCTACLGSGVHTACCAPDGSCCANPGGNCEACGGRGECLLSGVWSANLIEDTWVDAFFLRVILDHLGTNTPVMGYSGFPEVITFSSSGRDALLMPLTRKAGIPLDLRLTMQLEAV